MEGESMRNEVSDNASSNRQGPTTITVTRDDNVVCNNQVQKDLDNSKFDLEILEDGDEECYYDADDVLDTSDVISGALVVFALCLSLVALAMVLSGSEYPTFSKSSSVRSRRDIFFQYTSMTMSQNTTDYHSIQLVQFSGTKKPRKQRSTLSNCIYYKRDSTVMDKSKRPYTDLIANINLKDYKVLGFGCGVESGHMIRNVFHNESMRNATMSLLCVGYGTSRNSSLLTENGRRYVYSINARFLLCPTTERKTKHGKKSVN